MPLGKRIKKLRLEKELSLRALGKLAHISHSFIADIESGRSNPSLSTLEDLANALGTTTGFLLGEQPRTDNRKEELNAVIGTGNEYFTFHKDIPRDALDEIVSYAEYVIKKHEEKKKKGK